MSTDDLEQELTKQTANAPPELLTRSFFFLCAALSIATTLAIVVLLVTEAAKFFSLTAPLMGVEGETRTIVQFLTGTEWNRPAGEFGVIPLVSATLQVTVGSAVVALPLGTATAVYLSEYASPELRSVLKPALEILAGIPTVVYGFFALVYVTPALRVLFPTIDFFNMASASILVGILIIPMVASISEDAMSAVPDDLRQAGYGMGATKFEVTTGIVIPAAISGIISSFILALSRAIGETMIVVVAAGSQSALHNPLNPADYLEGALPMTAAMVKLLTGDITGGGIGYRSLFAIGLTLFFITLAMNVISDLIAQHYREEY